MRKHLHVISLMLTLATVIGVMFSTEAIASAAYGSTAITGNTVKVIVSSEFIGNVYSDWERLNEVFKAHSNGEKSHYNETRTISASSSLSIGISNEALSASIGVSVEYSVATTIRGSMSAPLKSGESTAFYCRKHWKKYKITYDEITTTWTLFGGFQQQKTRKSGIVTIAIEGDEDDYGWFYAAKNNSKALKQTINAKYCDDNYKCKVK